MAKASPGKTTSDTVSEVMHEFKEGTLESSSGQKVQSRKQAIAIGLSEAREAGEKVAPPKKSKTKKAAASKKSAAKKSVPKKAGAKTAASKKSSAKK